MPFPWWPLELETKITEDQPRIFNLKFIPFPTFFLSNNQKQDRFWNLINIKEKKTLIKLLIPHVRYQGGDTCKLKSPTPTCSSPYVLHVIFLPLKVKDEKKKKSQGTKIPEVSKQNKEYCEKAGFTFFPPCPWLYPKKTGRKCLTWQRQHNWDNVTNISIPFEITFSQNKHPLNPFWIWNGEIFLLSTTLP